MRIGIQKAALLAAAAMTTSVASANYQMVFNQFTTNGSSVPYGQLTGEALPVAGQPNQVRFRFYNNLSMTGAVASSIMGVYFADGTLQDFGGMDAVGPTPGNATQSYGIEDWTEGNAPSNLPSGNSIGFYATKAFSTNVGTNGNPSQGVDTADDVASMWFVLFSNKTFDDVVAALENSTLRIGLHVQGIGAGGQSESFIDNPVPLPSAGFLALAGIGAIGSRRRRTV